MNPGTALMIAMGMAPWKLEAGGFIARMKVPGAYTATDQHFDEPRAGTGNNTLALYRSDTRHNLT
jgi:hypothetical protein